MRTGASSVVTSFLPSGQPSIRRPPMRRRVEACYPFHPATLSVFHRKWQALRQFQQTRGALAMFAQWISYVYKDSHTKARNEALITLGSAPLDWASFRAEI